MQRTIDSPSLLTCLTRERLVEVGRLLGVEVPASARKERQVEALVAGSPGLPAIVDLLQRDELKAICREHGLGDPGRARIELLRRVLAAAGEGAAVPAGYFAEERARRALPRPGDVVRVRHRQYLVEAVDAPTGPKRPGGPLMAHRVRLVGLDDDSQGRPLEVLWELELGARLRDSHQALLPEGATLDPPRVFGAYLATLRWHAVTATDARLFQAPFRAGIQLLNHQLVPLERALALPRANLFIADDVGLGKTIEAGLVLQELRLRQRVDFALVVCPAAICRQWRDELWRRFGLHFEIVNREFVARRRQERGFGVNPWATHSRFVISHQLLRRPEYRDPLLEHLGERARKSLLILDEAHVAAPASASRYAVDSRITDVIRDVAPRFENRLFLSATPHNGHSNSFSALLELLDPQRFHRGVPVRPAQRDKVMVRRLKSDLKALGTEFPRRHVVRVDLRQESGAWQASLFDDAGPAADGGGEVWPLGDAEPFELELASLLARYSRLVQPTRKNGRLALIRLQQRLLSGVEPFYRTLHLYARSVESAVPAAGGEPSAVLDPDDSDEELDDDELEEQDGVRIALAARAAPPVDPEARRLLGEMLALADRWRHAPDAKARALLAWIARHACPAVAFGGAERGRRRQWSGRRVIVFTEFGHTLAYLERLLSAAFEGTDLGSERLAIFRGGMDDARRDDLQRRWNAPPEDSPLRVLLATDAAREGVNLQGACHDLFHFDVPWNPARIEQRNGRIDRTLQPSPDVYCHYFTYRDRAEDRVLDTLVRKVEVIKAEVGSLGAVIHAEIERALEGGIGAATADQLARAGELGGRRAVVRGELDDQRHLAALAKEIDDAGVILNRSRDTVGLRPDLLRRTLDVALELIRQPPLAELAGGLYRLPPLPESWQETLDTLRPRRSPDEPLWEWRRRPPMPVSFEPATSLREDRVQLHLEHPLVQRLLARFLALGFGAGDLARVTALRDPGDARVHVVLFGRLSLFGPGATRLHDQLLAVAAPWREGEALEPLDERQTLHLVERLWQLFEQPVSAEAVSAEEVPAAVADRLRHDAPATFERLWPALRDEADHHAHRAGQLLASRGVAEAAELKALLEEQRTALQAAATRQLSFDFGEAEKDQKRQWENDRRAIEARLASIESEIAAEPAQLEALFQIALRRLEPVGLVYLWPTSR